MACTSPRRRREPLMTSNRRSPLRNGKAPVSRLTEWSGRRHDAAVALGPIARRALTCLLTVSIASLLVLPTEHLHRTEMHDGHHASVIHRHFAPHHDTSEHTNRLGYGDDDPEWLDSPFLRTNVTPRLQAPDVRLGERFVVPPPASPIRGHAVDDAPQSFRDPPLTPSGLRGPPLLPL